MTDECKVLVKNLSYAVTSRQLEDFCSGSGALRNAFVVMDKTGQRSRGYGYAHYATPEGATAALTTLQGGLIQVGASVCVCACTCACVCSCVERVRDVGAARE